MENIYLFNLETGEYAATVPYVEESEIPENGTLKEVPEVGVNEVAVFDTEDDEWEVKKDYRFTHKMVDKDNKVYAIEDIGEIPAGYTLKTNEEAAVIEEKNRIKTLCMTKYDFFKVALKPNNITYANLEQILATDDNMRAAWNLCAYVYRGDKTLCDNISVLVPALTSDVLDDLFLEYGKERSNLTEE